MPRRGAREVLGFLLLAILLGGCGTFASKVTGPDETQGFWLGLGHPYEGVTGDVAVVKCTLENTPPQPMAMRVLVTIALIVDLPFSLVADTIMLPIDIAVKPKRTRVDPGVCNAPLQSR